MHHLVEVEVQVNLVDKDLLLEILVHKEIKQVMEEMDYQQLSLE